MEQYKILKGLYRGRKQGNSGTLPDLKTVQKGWLRELQATGIVAITDYISSDAAAQLKSAIDERLDSMNLTHWQMILEGVKLPENKYGVLQPDGERIWTDRHFSDQRINHFEKISEPALRFANDDVLRSIGSVYLNRNISLRFCMANRTTFVAENTGSGGGWHRDMNYRRGFKALLYLVDVDENNGCFQYIPRSSSVLHHLLKTPVADKYQFTHQEVLHMVGGDESHIINMKARAGTLVLFDTNGVHRGKPIEHGKRYALTNYYHD